MSDRYYFNPITATQECVRWIQNYFIHNGPECKAVIGISGGKDSSVVAALCVKALGKDNVIAIKMPQGEQSDIEDANQLIDFLGIPEENTYEINIGKAVESIYDALDVDAGLNLTTLPQVTSNAPARVRMTILYAMAAALHGRVANTCNLSEDYVGYSTKFGDSAGDFSLLANLTSDEVIKIGRELNLPENLLVKPPADGLCGKTDEDNLGFTYQVLNDYIRKGIRPKEYKAYQGILIRHENNRHKVEPMPTFKPSGLSGCFMRVP